jgi:hypothetical protein
MATECRSPASLGKGFPRPVRLMKLDDFDKNPHRALIDASAGDYGTLIYTAGRYDDKTMGFAGVAVIVPVEEYRRLTLKADT